MDQYRLRALSGACKPKPALVPILMLAVLSGATWANCPDDRPCFNGTYQQGDKVIFEFNGITGWDFYNVRYREKGGGERQVENRSGIFTINNVLPNRVYTISVQGCNSRTLAPSQCTPWVSESLTTVGAYGPDTCRQGFVWREAKPGDHVCVYPGIRDRVAAENAVAGARRQSGGGPYGPNTCIQGYVWREAFPGDTVCVTPATRDDVRAQNERAAATRLNSSALKNPNASGTTKQLAGSVTSQSRKTP
ncbi:fibronectin type III domain-containing protein [Rugamonas rivuli]|uniref:Fibronectin type III domain-containing protein n=1 Tax=Rugamonas rivuli TaxID=2743358 RepID=A0A843S6T7_9BURK|nr:hypothetical protein [Rugamonas rivuli]MQA18432.1 hypothetical protein [Rugamonas rivuli]